MGLSSTVSWNTTIACVAVTPSALLTCWRILALKSLLEDHDRITGASSKLGSIRLVQKNEEVYFLSVWLLRKEAFWGGGARGRGLGGCSAGQWRRSSPAEWPRSSSGARQLRNGRMGVWLWVHILDSPGNRLSLRWARNTATGSKHELSCKLGLLPSKRAGELSLLTFYENGAKWNRLVKHRKIKRWTKVVPSP